MSGKADWVSKDFYAQLGVAKDASAADIKKAYRKLARANHPDSHPDESEKHEKFKAVAEAYDVIGDAEKRKEYDEVRALGPMGMGGGFGSGASYGGGGFGGGAGGYDINDLFRQQGGAGGGAGGFGDMFGDLFGGGGGARQQRVRRPRKGMDAEASATLGFTEAMDGATIPLRLTSEGVCPDCDGTGGKPGTRPHICPECEGAGFIVANAGGGFSLNETCPMCGGRQLIYDEACPTCLGSGHASTTRTVRARIPAGVKDGQKIRLRGKGGPGENGGPAGDLIVTVKVAPHRLFGRKGDNLTLEVPVSFDEAALGAQLKVPTLGGSPVTLKIPAGTPNGRTFRVRGKGAPKKDGTRGDLLVAVEVQVPASLSEGAREAVEAYRDARADQPLRAALFEDA